MAIDTPEKRMAAANLPFTPQPFVTVNSSKDAQWRQQSVGTYSGITVDPPGSPSASASANRFRRLLRP